MSPRVSDFREGRIFYTAVRENESLGDAIVRAGFEANKGGYSGYEIVCKDCGQPIGEHESKRDCEIWKREFGVQEFHP